MKNLKNILNIQKIIDASLYKYIYMSNRRINKNIMRAMKYSMTEGGKRMRSILCIASIKLIQKKMKRIIPIASAIEILHTYSLIHDDTPLMDDDILRRGKLTSHVCFGETTAILTGNSLLNLSFEIVSKHSLFEKKYQENISSDIVNKISIATGFKGMISGQMSDIESEKNFLNYKKIRSIYLLKTKILIDISIVLPSMVYNSKKIYMNKLKIYSKNLGIAYQVIDDILNIIGISSKLGKNTKTDFSKIKNTYPSIFGIEISKCLAKKQIIKSIIALSNFGDEANYLRSISVFVLKRII